MNTQVKAYLKQLNDPKDNVRAKGLKRLSICKGIEKLSADEKFILSEGIFRFVWLADQKVAPTHLTSICTFLVKSSIETPVIQDTLFYQFLLALKKNWSGIDRFRLNKFYLLIDVLLKVGFDYSGAENLVMVSLDEVIFCYDNFKNDATGLRTHFARGLFDQLKKQPLHLKLSTLLIHFMAMLPSNDVAPEVSEYLKMETMKLSGQNIRTEVFSVIKNTLTFPGISSKSRHLLATIMDQ